MLNTPSPGLVIFDLDYTLTKRGTWGRFVWMNIKARPHIWLPLLFSTILMQWRYKRGQIPRVRVKQAMMRWSMVGKSRKNLDIMAERFAEKEIKSGLRPGALQALERHRAQGDNLMIASAAVDILVEQIARKLFIPHHVSTEMAWDSADLLLPNFASENCYGEEKLRRVKEYISRNPELKQNHTIITTYSDSRSDLALLSFYDIGKFVDPDERLSKEASNHGLSVISWK